MARSWHTDQAEREIMGTIRQAPAPLDLCMVYGDDFTFTIHSSIDLSGYTLSAKVGSVTLTVSETSGMEAGYYYDITITAVQSSAFTSDSMAWTLTWTDTLTKKRTAIAGTIRRITV